jgi:hypothetical protein
VNNGRRKKNRKNPEKEDEDEQDEKKDKGKDEEEEDEAIAAEKNQIVQPVAPAGEKKAGEEDKPE